MKRGFIIICILICGCKQNSDTLNLNVIDFYSNPGTEISNLSEIATDIEYIPLQISGTCLAEIRITGDRYYIQNCSQEIECLDKNGRYLYKLSKKGNAADEYLALGYFDVNSDGNLLTIGTYKAIKIYENNDTGFVFLKSIDNFNPCTFSFVPGKNNLLLSCQNLGTIPYIDILINPKGDTLDARSNYNRLKRSLTPSIFTMSIHYKYNNALHFREPVNDTIYTIDSSDNIRPYLVLDSHGQQVTQKILARTQSEKRMMERWNYFSIMKFSETSRYMIGLILYRKAEFIRIYDKALNKYYCFANSSYYIKDNIAGGVDFMPLYCDGSKLYYWISASKLKEHVAGDGFLNSEVNNPEKKANLKELADSLQDPDSKVLIVVTPKE
jgi:hypothetical protein